MGFTAVETLRLGRYFEFEVDDSRSEAEWRACLAEALKRPISGFPNPITENWEMEVVP
jgi:phosphoribosylformylglycinamidine (FGAM) synthase PurS component